MLITLLPLPGRLQVVTKITISTSQQHTVGFHLQHITVDTSLMVLTACKAFRNQNTVLRQVFWTLKRRSCCISYHSSLCHIVMCRPPWHDCAMYSNLGQCRFQLCGTIIHLNWKTISWKQFVWRQGMALKHVDSYRAPFLLEHSHSTIECQPSREAAFFHVYESPSASEK